MRQTSKYQKKLKVKYFQTRNALKARKPRCLTFEINFRQGTVQQLRHKVFEFFGLRLPPVIIVMHFLPVENSGKIRARNFERSFQKNKMTITQISSIEGKAEEYGNPRVINY